MKHDMLDPKSNRPLDAIYASSLHEKKPTKASLGRVLGVAAVAGVIFGAISEREPSNNDSEGQIEITQTVESGQTVQDILLDECPTASEADLLAMQAEVGQDLDAANPANPQVSAGDRITVTVPAELCKAQ